MNNVLFLIYNILTFVLSFLVSPLFLLKERGRRNFLERFGSWKIKNDKYIWFHGASIGEIKGFLPVLKKIKEKGEQKILVTSTSPTGLDVAKDIADEWHLLPFDSSFFYKRLSKRFTPTKIIITETEIWPSFINYFSNNNIDMYKINAIISDMTIKRYKMFKFFIAPLLNSFKKIMVQTNKELEHFKSVGVKEDKLIVAGNSKYEITLKVNSEYEALEIYKTYFPDENINKVITLASIRPNEEKMLFPALKELCDNNNDIGLIIAPRHKEKFSYFGDKLNEYGFNFTKWTENKGGKKGYKVVLLDTYGELEKTFSFSNLVFIGASIENIGGHNPLEAMVYGAYVFMGEHYQNYEEIINTLLEKEYVSIVREEKDLEDLLVVLQNFPDLLKEKGKKAKEYAYSLCGATKIILNEIGM